MAELDVSDDFLLVADFKESVTLRRRDSTKELHVELARRQQLSAQEAEPSGGNAIQADATWQLQLPPAEPAPQVGDVIVDQQKNCWTILETQELFALGRCKCETRELRLAFGCHQLLDVQRPVWDDLGSGPEIVDWTDVCTALPAHIRLDEMLIDSSTTPPTKQLIYEFVLAELPALELDDRLIDERGTSYRLQSLTQAQRIDQLPVAKAIREESS